MAVILFFLSVLVMVWILYVTTFLRGFLAVFRQYFVNVDDTVAQKVNSALYLDMSLKSHCQSINRISPICTLNDCPHLHMLLRDWHPIDITRD